MASVLASPKWRRKRKSASNFSTTTDELQIFSLSQVATEIIKQF